ncbi:diguanylate cyclase [Sphingomonas sp.]|uniref:GGDEF domain-containing protein n=1 Tax=Sphingomonas sp. TaxID=28214 RepID=UPI003B3BE8AB
MRFDLLTLYLLAVGTLLLSAGMTLWEREARPQRRRELGILAAAYATLAFGCAVAIGRHIFPGTIISGASNLILVSGYLLVLHGVASLSGRRHRKASVILLVLLAATWVLAGSAWGGGLWNYVSALPIALVSAATAWEVTRSDRLRGLRSRPIVVGIVAFHALFYATRIFALPPLAEHFGPDILSVAAKITMYEGVLYSVGMPMALLALIREEAHEQLLNASQTDYLTGVGNRRWFFEQGEKLVQKHLARQPVSLLLFDLDHFKTINDRFGHSTGDEVLKLFAHIALRSLGPNAIFARVGGEEFAALVPGQTRMDARAAGQSLSIAFSNAAEAGIDGVCVDATVSIGLAELGNGMATLSSAMSAADRALYAAKALGRNRIELAEPVEQTAP